MVKQRNARIDILRGLLILTVIVGHIVIGSIHTQPVRYAIYAFHMPLFIVLTGFLVNTQWLAQAPLGDIMRRYWSRVLQPFLVAFIVFTGVLAWHAWQEHRLDTSWWVASLVSPYYHLWFIPTLVIWVLALAIMVKIRFWLPVALLISMAVSLLWAAVDAPNLPKLAAVLVSKKVVYFFSFFLFGVALRQWLTGDARVASQHWLTKLPSVGLLAVLGVGAWVYATHIGVAKSPERSLAWLALNGALALLCIRWFSAYATHPITYTPVVRAAGVLEAMGRLSLPLYLWHVLPLFALKGLDVHQSAPLTYYAMAIVGSMIITVLVLRLEHKSVLLDRWLYGALR